MNKIIVYGSLLSGFGNHRLLENENTTLLGEDIISIPYGMISYGGFPALVPAEKDHKIHVEIYECDEKTYRRVELLEGYPSFYQKYEVDTKYGKGEIYVINNEKTFEHQDSSIKVDGGSWKEWIESRKTGCNYNRWYA